MKQLNNAQDNRQDSITVVITLVLIISSLGFPGGSVAKNLPANVGDMGLIPVWEDPTYHGATTPVCHNY